MAETGIPYCDRTWDLTIGCRKRSPGCDNCWACRTVHRLAGRGLSGYEDQVACTGGDWLFTSKVNCLVCNLSRPLHWRKPSFIFVNSKSDLFDERVPFEFIARAFDVMCNCRQHRFMVLTKEPGRMAEFIEWYQQRRIPVWPDDFPHVILMVSVEGPEYISRIETLRRIPAAMRGVSLEPLISRVSDAVTPFIAEGYNVCPACYWWGEDDGDPKHGQAYPCPKCGEDTDAVPLDELLDWVVVGCEKLAGGRAGRWTGIDPVNWWEEAQGIVTACRDAGVPVWMKQGPRVPPTGSRVRVTEDAAEFPPECRIQEKPKGLRL